MKMVQYDRILLGDCVEVMGSLPPKIADLVVADPPYFLRIDAPLKRPNGNEVVGVTQDWDRYESLAAFDDFTRRWLVAARRLLKDNGALWVSGTYHNIHRVGTILTDLGFFLRGEVVWIKRNPMPNFRGVRFCNAHETILWATAEKAPGYTFHYQDMKAANGGKQMRSDWHFPVCSGRERLRTHGKAAHVVILAVRREFRGKAGLMWPVCVEMWRYCEAEGISEITLEATEPTLRVYCKLGFPLKVVGELSPHWGEPCVLASLNISQVAVALTARADLSGRYRDVVDLAHRSGPAGPVEKLGHI